MNALEIVNLGKTYNASKGKSVVALSGLHLTIAKGEVFGFLGPNGAGKSTTIKSLMGLIRPTAGKAYVAGISIEDPNARHNIGYLPENPSFFDFLTGREYLQFVGRSFHMNDELTSKRSIEILDKLELTDAADRQIRGYSKGMVQRLGLAQTLVHDPDLYIFDEPMSGLDPLGRALVKNLIIDIKNSGKTVFFSTHITADVEAVCDRVAVVVKGDLKAVDRVENILESGIEGYTVKVRGEIADFISGNYNCLYTDNKSLAIFSIYKDDFKEFISSVSNKGLEIDMIEPVRKNIEQFFLEIVEKGNK